MKTSILIVITVVSCGLVVSSLHNKDRVKAEQELKQAELRFKEAIWRNAYVTGVHNALLFSLGQGPEPSGLEDREFNKFKQEHLKP